MVAMFQWSNLWHLFIAPEIPKKDEGSKRIEKEQIETRSVPLVVTATLVIAVQFAMIDHLFFRFVEHAIFSLSSVCGTCSCMQDGPSEMDE